MGQVDLESWTCVTHPDFVLLSYYPNPKVYSCKLAISTGALREGRSIFEAQPIIYGLAEILLGSEVAFARLY